VFEKEMEMVCVQAFNRESMLGNLHGRNVSTLRDHSNYQTLYLSRFFVCLFFFLAELAIQFAGYENRHAEEKILTYVRCNQR
jgi:hypothetical protein